MHAREGAFRFFLPAVFLSFLFILVFAGALLGQSATLISGFVTDQTGAMTPGAKVTLTNQRTGVVLSATSGETGYWEIRNASPGVYDIRSELEKFSPAELKDVEIAVNVPVTVKLKFLSSTLANVVIEVHPIDAALGNTIRDTQIESLPILDRNVVSLMNLQPGVVSTEIVDPVSPDTRGGANFGAHSDQISISLDGINVNDQQTGAAFKSVLPTPMESIKEFGVITVIPDADKGRSSGSHVELVTRSGTNQVHGSLYEFNRNTFTSANNFFNNSTIDPLTGKTLARPKYNQNIFGMSLGGPIQKNRLSYFFNYENTITRREIPQQRIVPSDTFRAGVIRYINTSGGISSAIAPVLATIDPLGIGPDGAIVELLNQYPRGNDPSLGDGGLNTTGFRFNDPIKENKPAFVANLDFNATSRQRLTLRMSFADYKIDDRPPQFPGQDAARVLLDKSKGLSFGYTTTINSGLVNSFRWGFTRQDLRFSNASRAPGLDLRGIDALHDTSARNNGRTLPTNEILEDLSWIRGNHTIQFGVNLRNIHNKRFSEEKTYATYSANSSWLGGPSYMPADVSSDFAVSYGLAQATLFGLIDQVDKTFYFDKNGKAFAAPYIPQREFINSEVEWYVQDQWKTTRNLTVTAGLRYSYYAPPYERNGYQVRPSFDVHGWFSARQNGAVEGIPSSANPALSFVLAGKTNNAAPIYAPDKNNFAPRLALAWTPSEGHGPLRMLFGNSGATTFRAGGAILYDRSGGMLPVTSDLSGGVGLSTSISTEQASYTYTTSPRFTGIGNLAQIPSPPAPTSGFPSVPDATGGAGFMVDTKLRTPYALTFDFSISRHLPQSLTLELAYAARLGRKQLVQNDYAAPLTNFTDPKSGQSWVQAAGMMTDLLNRNTAVNAVSPIPFFENVFAPLATSTQTATQAVYAATAQRNPYSWTDVLHLLDVETDGGSTIYGPYTFFQPQYVWLPTWTNLGQSSYHSFQFILRRQMAKGFQADFNYTLAKSIDNGSSVESEGQGIGQLLNSFDPRQALSASDFDVRHQVNSNFVWDVPFGRNASVTHSSTIQQILRNWTVSGVMRWRTGFPFPGDSGNGFSTPTSFNIFGPPTLKAGVAIPETRVNKDAAGGPNIFANPDAAFSAFEYTRSGFSGSRNVLYGPGYFSVDSSFQRVFKVSERQSIRLRWDIFNVTNTVNFDGRAVGGHILNSGIEFNLVRPESFGHIQSTAGTPRIMQFAIRYEF